MLALSLLGLLLTFAPARIQAVEQSMVTRPGPSALGGLASAVGLVPLYGVLARSVLGLPLVPLAVLAVLVALVAGLSTSSIWLGHRLPLLRAHESPVTALALGVLLLTGVTLVPVLGQLVVLLASFVAAGAVALSRFGSATSRPFGPTLLASCSPDEAQPQ